MNRLLIIDDEPYIVESMEEMLSEIEDLELEIHTAYSSEEAVEILTRKKIDIVLSDIRMPGMDGLQLQERILERWPRCQVIFLTGMSDFSSIQQAIRNRGTDYILKTEGDEAIERAIRQAVARIREESLNEQFLLRAKDQLWQALPLLRKDWFMGLLDPQSASSSLKPAKMEELGVLLRPDRPVLLVAGRVDRWREEDGDSGRTLLLYAIQNIAEEYLSRVLFLPILLEGSHFAWMIQPALPYEADWEDTAGFVLGTLESIQATCRDLLRLPVSFVTTGSAAAWDRLAATYRHLRQTMILGLGDGQDMLITYCETETEDADGSPVFAGRLSELEQMLESGRQQEWDRLLDESFQAGFKTFASYAEFYYAVALMLLRQLNAAGAESPEGGDTAKRLMDLDGHPTKEAAVSYLKETASRLLERRKRTVDERTVKIIQKLNHHIREHLADDLSLDTLASVVYLNASYLSTLYKQSTGRNLFDYISELRIDMAKELLARSPLKIHEIAVQVGFATAGYFTRFFKRHTGTTPQEYRAAHEK
ncbi:response regulator transcription factor [Cohnella candidum]|uniref:Response regulator n=1 Tax=Cohnella candidum TaxID=2674991 RepID=A0A3G3JTK5_9BACL|nr:response regulator [Cohnella candidum]AYQ71542.1 response regulator [Cohnella candidum]